MIVSDELEGVDVSSASVTVSMSLAVLWPAEIGSGNLANSILSLD